MAKVSRDEPAPQPRRYWNTHPIATESVPFERGSVESFDAIVERWESQLTPRRRAFLESCSGDRVLEIGCGLGVDGRFFATHGAIYQAVDLSSVTLQLARKHFQLKSLPVRFANADATRLPFAPNTFDVIFSSGVLHHVPDMQAACREVVRVLRPGGRARMMLYHRHSYHYLLVHYGVRPMIWLLLHMPGGRALSRRLPRKFREIFDICETHGFSADRILSASTDTSTAGEDNYNPLSYFVTRAEVEKLLEGLEDFEFYTTDLKYFPLPFGRRAVEERFGFFLQITARKPTASDAA